MKGITKLAAISLLALCVTGCDDDDDDRYPIPEIPAPPPPAPEPEPTPMANLRVVHAAPDAPDVNVYAGGAILAGLENVDYQVSSPWIEVDAGTYDVRVEANVPSGNLDVITASLTLEGDTNYEVIAIDTVADEVEALVIANAASAVTAGNARVQVVHAAPAAPEVDIYVTAPDDALDAAQPLATASFRDFTGQVEVPTGDYRIRITPAGDMTVVFDSGTFNLPDGADLLVMATENVGTGDSPVTLLAADGTSSFKIWDADTTADIRVVHGIADAPAVDVVANDAITLFDAAMFPMATDYLSVAPDTYSIDVVADADNSVVAIEDADVTLETGMFYTAIANNTLAMPELDLLTDTPRAVATEAKVRIIHASPSAGDVDIYVTADGEIADVDPAFSAVPYSTETLAETGYVSLAPGDYVVTVTAAGSKDAAIETGTLSLEAGMVYTAVAVDGATMGDAPQIIGLDGLAPAPEPMASPNLRVVHASADAPTVNVYANDALLGGLENVDYQVASMWMEVPAGDYAVRVDANLPDDTVTPVINANLTLEDGMNYNVLAVGSVAAGTLEPLVIANEQSEIDSGNVQVQVVHAAQNAPEVNIYVTAPDMDLTMATPLATAAYKQYTDQFQVPAGDYQIRITPVGTVTTVFDSGTVSLLADASLLVMATESILPGDSPVTLLVSTGSDTFTIADVNTPANLRVVHGIADAPAVDVIANDAVTLVDGAAFLDATDYLWVTPDTYSIDVAADADNSIIPIENVELTLASGMYYTAIANNLLATPQLDVLVDMPRAVATETKVRIVHASQAAGTVDIYVTADGNIADADPAFAGVPYSTDDLAETGYVSLPAGDYVVTVTGAGSKDAAIETGTLSLMAGEIYTAIAVDGNLPDDAPQLILLDSFN